MSLSESINRIREEIELIMNQGLIRETPGAVIEQIENKTSKIIWRISKKKYNKTPTREKGFTEIAAASIVEQEKIKEYRGE